MEDIYVDLRTQNAWIQKEFPDQDFAAVSELFEKIENLRDELNEVQTDFEIFKQDVADNYRPVTVAEQLDITDSDFI